MSDPASSFKSGFVALIGRPNTGKSTLLNALVGRKVAIVSPKPQTTRNRIAGIVHRNDAQIVFLDTPGLHEPRTALGENLVAAARGALPDAEVVCLVVDGTEEPSAEDQRAAALLKSASAAPLLVLNKIDALPSQQIEARLAAYARLAEFRESLPVSATQGTHLDRLLDLIVSLLPPGPRYFPEDMVTDHALEFRIAELIREAVLELTHQEVPHALAVQVDERTERRADLTYLAATLIVERDAHKGILIGAKGGMLKQIGQRARAEIEALLGTRVFMELRVKVREKWRQDDSMLERLGYNE